MVGLVFWQQEVKCCEVRKLFVYLVATPAKGSSSANGQKQNKKLLGKHICSQTFKINFISTWLKRKLWKCKKDGRKVDLSLTRFHWSPQNFFYPLTWHQHFLQVFTKICFAMKSMLILPPLKGLFTKFFSIV